MNDDYCRLCAQLQPIEDIVQADETVKSVNKILLKFFKIDLNAKSDRLPNNICTKCSIKAHHVHEFDEQIQQAQVQLSRLLQDETSGNTDEGIDDRDEDTKTNENPTYGSGKIIHDGLDTINIYENETNRISFWRKNIKAPGKVSTRQALQPHATKNVASLAGTSSASAFNEYQASVNDAWELGDEEFIAPIKNISLANESLTNVGVTETLTVHNTEKKNHMAKKNIIVTQEKNSIALSKIADTKNVKDVKDAPAKPQKVQKHERSYPGRPRALHSSILSLSNVDCENKLEKFETLLNNPVTVDLNLLRELSWSGIPSKVRAITWKILAEYVPVHVDRRDVTLERKRLDYWSLVKQYFDVERDDTYKDTYRQIHIDIPRTNPLIPLFQQRLVQESFERILFIWAIRHPASGYVQGINDLVTPFYIVFLQDAVGLNEDLDTYDVSRLSRDARDEMEADVFWCLSKFLESIQDNYIFAQLGIQKKVIQLKEIVQRVDKKLHDHLTVNSVDYLQFSFRWFNNLLTRELPLHCTIRLWDTHLAEADEFATFQLYVCAAFLLHWKEQLCREPDFQGLLLLLQNLPTSNWSSQQISLLVAEAYRLKFMFADAPNHFGGSNNKTDATR